MSNVIVRIVFSDVRFSRRKDGRCWCGSDPIAAELVANPSSEVSWDCGVVKVTGYIDVESTGFYESQEAVTYRGLPMLRCQSSHLYVNRAVQALGTP